MTMRLREVAARARAEVHAARADGGNVPKQLAHLQACADRVSKVLTAVRAQGGTLRPEAQNEITQLAHILLGLLPAETKLVSAKASKREDEMTYDHDAKKRVLKVAQDHLFVTCELLARGEADPAYREMDKALLLLHRLRKSDAPKTTSVTLTWETLGEWAKAQMQAAQNETPEEAKNRLAHVSHVVERSKALFTESQGNPLPTGFTVEMETAYAPLAPWGGKAMDVTVKEEQAETDIALVQEAEQSRLPEYTLAKATTPCVWPVDMNLDLLSEEDLEKGQTPLFKRELVWGKDPEGLRDF